MRVARGVSVDGDGIALRRFVGAGAQRIPLDRIASVERLSSGLGFRLHLYGGTSVVVLAWRRRSLEAQFRATRLVIVDEWGAQIDASQFEKEGDPTFRRLRTDDDLPSLWWALVPNSYLRWRHRRRVRQSSDDA
jgi:hypothetical protein